MKATRAVPFIVAAGLAGAIVAWRSDGERGGGRVTGQLVGVSLVDVATPHGGHAPVGSGVVVVLIDPAANVGLPMGVGADGRFAATVPPGAREPFVVIDTRRGALVRSRALAPASGGDLGPLAIWETAVRVQRAGPRVRVDWGPIPTGPGYPPRVRYSLLVGYTRTDAPRGEATFPSREPALEADLDELLGFLPHRDERATELVLEVRAFDPEDLAAPLWIGARVRWRMDTNQVTPAPDGD